MAAHEAQLVSHDAQAAVTAETLLERIDLERLFGPHLQTTSSRSVRDPL